MNRIYEVIVETDLETATREYHVVTSNAERAMKRGLMAYRADAKKGDRLYGHARVTRVKEIGRAR